MGPSDLDRFTELELAELQLTTSRRVLTQYENAEHIYTQMHRMTYPSATYTAAKQRADTLADAAREAHELLDEITAKLEAVRAARKADADA